MGIGAGMRAAMLLEVDLKLEGQLEEQLELNPRKPREIRPDPPKSGFLVQNGLPHCKRALEPLSKTGNGLFAPGTFYTIPAPHSTIYMKSAFSRNPRRPIHAATPPFSSISFLLTAHARNAPPSTVEAVRVVRAGLGGEVWAVRSGR